MTARAFNASSRTLRRAALWGGIAFVLATVQYAIAQVVVAADWSPAYSWSRNFISDLGNTGCGQFAVHGPTSYVCSPLHNVMNGSFVAGGLLTLVGVIAFWRMWPAGRLTRTALVLWLAAGALKVLVGLAPENTSKQLHVLGAFNLPLQGLAILLLSMAIWQGQRGLAVFGWVIGVVSLVAATLTTAAQSAGGALNLGLGNGGMERLAGYPGNLWILVIGAVMVTRYAFPAAPSAIAAPPSSLDGVRRARQPRTAQDGSPVRP